MFTDYMAEMTDEDGVQESNLDKDEVEGIKTLKERVESCDIVVCATDKSGRFAIMTMEDYRWAGRKHTENDEEVDLAYVKRNQRVLNAHCSMLIKVFLVGKNWEHESRIRETYITNSLNVCPFYLLFKDHKGWKGHMGTPPPTRGIAGASSGQNGPLSELISMVCEPIASSTKHGFEKISSSDVLSQVVRMNKETESKSRGGSNGHKHGLADQVYELTSNEGELDRSGCDEMSEGQQHLDISSEYHPGSQGREQQTGEGNIPV